MVLVITASRHLGAQAGRGAQSHGYDAGAALKAQLAEPRGAFDKANLTAFVKGFKARLDAQENVEFEHPDLVRRRGAGRQRRRRQRRQAAGRVPGGRRHRRLLPAPVRPAGRRRSWRRACGPTSSSSTTGWAPRSRCSNPGDNEVAKQAMADASERYNTCGATLATADSPAEFAAARRTAVEGSDRSPGGAQGARARPGPGDPRAPRLGTEAHRGAAAAVRRPDRRAGGRSTDPDDRTTTAAARSTASRSAAAGTPRRSGSRSCSARSCPAASAVAACSAAAAASSGATKRAVSPRSTTPAAMTAVGAATGAVAGLRRRWRRRRLGRRRRQTAAAVAGATGSPQAPLICRP